MKHLRVFESFNNIDAICQRYNIRNYTINDDGSIDVDGSVDISAKGLTKIPLKFNKVSVNFICSSNYLTSLEGCPSIVGGIFNSSFNNLISLDGCPTSIGGNFDCSNNQLKSLNGCPKYVGGDFYCYNNQLKSLEGGPITIGEDFYCYGNQIYNIFQLFKTYKEFKDSMDYGYLRGTDIIKSRFQEALDEFGVEMPKKIEGYNYI